MLDRNVEEGKEAAEIMQAQKRWNESNGGKKNECDKPVKWFMATKQNKIMTKICQVHQKNEEIL